MADTMEWTGRTVEAALEAAAADLGCAPASLEYTVLEQPSRGFLGLIGRRMRASASAISMAPQWLR